MRISFLLILILLSVGCAHPRASDGRFHVVEGVPFRPQVEKDDCGAAALASLLAHKGLKIPVPMIDRSVRDPRLGGVLLADLENYARSLGYDVRSGRGDLDLLRHRIDAGCPLAIPVQRGFWVFTHPHFLVVYGYDARSFLVHDGRREGGFVASGTLLESWEKMNRLYLVLE